jgi:hypothetical protein
MSATTMDQIRHEYEKLAQRRLTELRERFAKLEVLRANIDTELLVLADEIEHFGRPLSGRRRPRGETPECGTESGYQWHRHRGEACEACKVAHRHHERIASARRKLRKLSGDAA